MEVASTEQFPLSQPGIHLTIEAHWEIGSLQLAHCPCWFCFLSKISHTVACEQSGCTTVDGVNDGEEFKHTKRAMEIIGIAETTQREIFKLLAAILHVGNLTLKDKGAF